MTSLLSTSTSASPRPIHLSRFFTPWKDPKTGVTSYLLTRGIAPLEQTFYFTNPSFSADGRYYWFDRAFPPAGNVYFYGRSLGVIDLVEDRIHHFPETGFLDASPMVDKNTGEAYWCTNLEIWKRRPEPEAKPVFVNRFPSELARNRHPARVATHLTMSADGKNLNIDAEFGREWFLGHAPLDGGPVEIWQKSNIAWNHSIFSPTDPDLQLFCETNSVDPLTGDMLSYTNHLWLIRRGEKARPLYPNSIPYRQKKVRQFGHDELASNQEVDDARLLQGHHFWSEDGQSVWYCHYMTGLERLRLGSTTPELVWPHRTISHARVSASEKYLVFDVLPPDQPDIHCVTFVNLETKRTVDIVSHLPVLPREIRRYHIDAHPQFDLSDRYIYYTTTVRNRVEVAVLPVDELIERTSADRGHPRISAAMTMNPPQPRHRFISGSEAIHILHPSARTITRQGRSGLSFTSIRGRAAVPLHTLNERQGSIAIWLLPLQEFFPAAQHDAHKLSNRFFDRYVFLTDHEAVQETEGANFKGLYSSYWHPVLIAEFEQKTSDALFGRSTGATAGHFEMHALTWYQLVLTWNHDTEIYVLYANGLKVGHSDTGKTVPSHADPPAPHLFFGSPAYAMGDISFYDQALTPEQVSRMFDMEVVVRDEPLQASLAKCYGGADLPRFAPPALEPEGWKLRQSLSLCQRSDYLEFYHQGCGPSVHFTPEGFRITTPTFDEYLKRRGAKGVYEAFDMTRMYLWTRRVFEGDLYVTVEFKLHAHGGLALLMTQAAGMQGEDFLADYPLRSDGSMSVVCWEDVRNYHWEFYREIIDVRNDLVSHAALKNPWFRPLSFQIENRTWELERWYRLTYCQEGSRLRGAIDDVTVMDVTDTGFDNNGPVLRHGHVALRCMMRTDITFRNLEIWNRPLFDSLPVHGA